ncbi:MAG: glycosyltransferase family 2 protein [Thermodesulfobacteriota bacterium]
MHSPSTDELVLPMSDKSGWPWTKETVPLPDGSPWPKITIVTPSFNQGEYIEETIRSVLLQGYPNLEYIIIDGGSTDDSVAIIKKYEPWLTFWTSGPDQGQSQAINKGFEHATGNILGYINSDDLYEPGALFVAAESFSGQTGIHLLAGQCVVFNDQGVKRIFQPWWPAKPAYYVSRTYSSTFAQPASFWSRSAFQELGGFDETLHCCFDREFFLRMGLAGIKPMFISQVLARFREHNASKSMTREISFHRESLAILDKHATACGISEGHKRRIARRLRMEIDYINVFDNWRNHGRLAALVDFSRMIRRFPPALCERKILGQARRLLFFRKKSVAELVLGTDIRETKHDAV